MPQPNDRTGRVAEYDPTRGWGTVLGDDGEQLGFHCTQIADGSRTIAPGAVVRYRRVAAHLGRYEAVGVVSV
jgi:cold shock CspA family protein